MWLSGRACGDKHLEFGKFKKTNPKLDAEVHACNHSIEVDEAGG